MTPISDPTQDASAVASLRRRFELAAILLFVVMLGLGLRFAAWDWGLVTESALRNAGYPDSLMPPDAARAAGGEAGSYLGSYAYDEETFGAALPMLQRARNTLGHCRSESVSPLTCFKRLYSGAYVDIDMAASPVAALYFSLATWIIAEKIYGINIAFDDRSPRDIRSDLRTPLLRWGRWLALPWLFLAAWIFMIYWRRLAGLRMHTGLAMALGLGVFFMQPNLLTHGRLLTYNFMMMAFELGLLALCLKWVLRTSSCNTQMQWALFTGMLGGIGLATKMTMAPVLVIALGFWAVSYWIQYAQERRIARTPRPLQVIQACITPLLFIGAAALFWFLLVHPALQAADGSRTLQFAERTLLGREDLNVGTPWSRALIYFTQTLPAAMGWPLYLTGLFGVASRLRRWSKLSDFERMTLAFLLLTMALYTSNPLGLAVQRTLTVIALFLVFAARGLMDIYHATEQRILIRRITWLWIGFILLGMLFGAFATTRLFQQDRPGYRNDMATWMLKNLDAGDTIWLEGKDPHTLSDLALVESLTDNPRFHWVLRLPEEYAGKNPAPIREETLLRAPWGHYYARCACGHAIAVFSSPAKTETQALRLLRMGFGYHRWDQIMVQPDFTVYKPFDR
jgi:hypothetical protein